MNGKKMKVSNSKTEVDKILFIIIVYSFILFIINYTHYDTFIGGGDSGEYMANAKLISSGNGLVFFDSDVKHGYSSHINPKYYIPSIQYHIKNGSQGLVRSDHFKGYPILMSSMRCIFGDDGYKIVSPFLGSLSLVIIYLIGSKLFGSIAGFFTSILLGTNWVQLWYSRFSMTETSLQCFLLLSILLVIIYINSYKNIYLFLAGCILGLAFSIHLSALFLLPGLIYIIYYQNSNLYIKRLLLLIVPLFTIAIIYLVIDSGNYFVYTIQLYLDNIFQILDRSDQIANNLTISDKTMIYMSSYYRYLSLVSITSFIVSIIYAYLKKDKQILSILIILITWVLILIPFGISNSGQHEPWTGRRLVPIIYPMTYLIIGAFLGKLSCEDLSCFEVKIFSNRLFDIRDIQVALCFLVFIVIVIQQIYLFIPFNNVSMGGNMPEFCDEIFNFIQQDNGANESIVILTPPSELFEIPMKYLYDISVINTETPEPELPNIINNELNYRDHIYILNYKYSELYFNVSSYGYKLSPVKDFNMLWTDPSEWRAFPDPSHRWVVEFRLYDIKKLY